jgi:hypothetical protein
MQVVDYRASGSPRLLKRSTPVPGDLRSKERSLDANSMTQKLDVRGRSLQEVDGFQEGNKCVFFTPPA